jgi:recombinational DNA repair protein (RecF pathway)
MEEGEVRPDIFHLLDDVLAGLVDDSLAPALLSLLFQMRFVGHEGLRPVLERCTGCQCELEEMPQTAFCIDLGKGGIVCNQCPTNASGHLHLSRGTLKQLQWIADGDLAKARRARFTAPAMVEATRFSGSICSLSHWQETEELSFLAEHPRHRRPSLPWTAGPFAAPS